MKHYKDSGILVRVGRQIAAMRKRSGMTQAELASKLHIDKESMARIEKGQYRLRMRLLFKIAQVFGKKLQVSLIKRKGGV